MSVPITGNFDCDQVQVIVDKNEDVFNPLNPNPDYVADTAPLKQLLAIQTAKFPDLLDPNKDTTVKVVTMDKCAVTADADFDITGTCEISGTEAGTTCRDYTLNLKKQSPGFSLSELKYRTMGVTHSWEDELAINLAAELKAMDQLIANAVVSFYDSIAAQNLYTGKYTIAPTETTIPAAAWNPDLFTYFAVARLRNRRPNMSLLLGGLMEESLLKVELETSNPEGGSAARKVKQLGNVWTDMFTTETVLSEKAAFLVDPDSVFFAHKARYAPYGKGKERIANGNKQVLRTVKSNDLPIVYNLIMQEKCVDGDTITSGQLFFEGLIDRAPTRCTDLPQVLKFVCG